MNNKLKKFLVAALSTLFVLCLACGCGGNKETTGEKGPEYVYNYNRPYRAECDSFMTIDGKLDEPQWATQNYLYCVGGEKNEIKMTTIFTQKGLYVGMRADDSHIVWNARYAMVDNSRFMIQVVKADEINYKDNYYKSHPTRQFKFAIDAKNTLSYAERRYDAASYFVGELNGDTSYISAELFLPWSEMGYTDEELNENGTPDAVKLLVQYFTPQKASGFPGFSDDNFYKTYYSYDEKGSTCKFDKNSETDSLGYSVNGWTPGDKWIVDETNKTATNTVDNTQILWFRKDVHGAAKSTGSHYIASVKVKIKPVTTDVYPFAGIMTLKSKTVFNIYGINPRNLTNGNVYLSAGRATDGGQWVGSRVFDKNYIKSGYEGGKVADSNIECTSSEVYLTVVKRDNELYYFCNGEFVGLDYDNRVSGECVVGLFDNGQSTLSEWSYEDFSDRTDELDEYLNKYIWFITGEDNGGGTLTLGNSWVRRGESLDINVVSNFGYVLSDLTVNGDSVLDEFIANADENGTISVTPDTNVKVAAKFRKISGFVDVFFEVRNESGTALTDASYIIRCGNDKRAIYKGQVNAKGNIVGSLMKAGTYDTDNGLLTIDGNYTIELSSKGYDDNAFKFSIPSDFAGKEIENTFVLREPTYSAGKATVNGTTVTGSEKVASYAPKTNKYTYATDGQKLGFVSSYETGNAIVTTGDYIVKLKMSASFEADFRIYASKDKYLTIRTGVGDDRILFIANSANAADTYWSETRIGGNTSLFANPANRNIKGEMELTIVRYKDKIYVYSRDYMTDGKFYKNDKWTLIYSFDGTTDKVSDGLNLYCADGSKSASGKPRSEFSGNMKAFFAAGQENAFGMTRVGGNVSWAVEINDDDTAAAAFVANPPTIK